MDTHSEEHSEESVVTPTSEKSKQTVSIPLLVCTIVLAVCTLVLGTYYVTTHPGLLSVFRPKTTVSEITPTVMPTETPEPTITVPSDWIQYDDPRIGMKLSYPSTVSFNEDGKGPTKPLLSISVTSIDSIPVEMPLGLDRATAIADKAALEKGEAVTKGDFAASDALVRINGKYNGRMTSVLSRFEVCSVLFTRTLVFYPGNYQVKISLNGVEGDIIKSMPEFFTIDAKNCGTQTMWNRDIMGTFLPTLAKGEGKGAAQVWYDLFTAITKTITFVPVSTSMTPLPEKVTQTCDVKDNAFCNVLSDIQVDFSNKTYEGLLAYQNTTTVTCDPDGMAISICEGAGKGVVKEGYGLGHNQSEGSVMTRDAYLMAIATYVTGNGPFIYKGSLVSGDKGMIVYLNSDASKLFVFPMKRVGSTWRFTAPIIGGTFGDTRYTTMSPSLLGE